MYFISKIEAYTYSLSLLTDIRNKLLTVDPITKSLQQQTIQLNAAIEEIKIMTENHEQDQRVILDLLETIKSALNQTDLIKIIRLQKHIQQSHYQQTPQAKYENPLARRLESELAITLLLTPTKATMDVVKHVSASILSLIESDPTTIREILTKSFFEDGSPISFGAPKTAPSLDHVKSLLSNNSHLLLTEIMYIHFRFSQQITRGIPIKHTPLRNPVGQLSKIIADLYPNQDAQSFFKNAIAIKGGAGTFYRSYISDVFFYQSALFTALGGKRGRLGGLENFKLITTHHLGLMLESQQEYEVGLPTHDSQWCADCKCQPADLESPYVHDLIENGAVYVAGPSGMLSILLNQMELLANFDDENLKKLYLTAIVAYIVGGGFHGLHEVIGPAQDRLNLVPGYHIQVPQAGKTALPPNYHHFFMQQAALDPEFIERREAAWEKYLTYFKFDYAPKHIKQPLDDVSLHQATSASDDNDATEDEEEPYSKTRKSTNQIGFFKPFLIEEEEKEEKDEKQGIIKSDL